jgi:ABC-type Fe3+ transport system permease subunit
VSYVKAEVSYLISFCVTAVCLVFCCTSFILLYHYMGLYVIASPAVGLASARSDLRDMLVCLFVCFACLFVLFCYTILYYTVLACSFFKASTPLTLAAAWKEKAHYFLAIFNSYTILTASGLVSGVFTLPNATNLIDPDSTAHPGHSASTVLKYPILTSTRCSCR